VSKPTCSVIEDGVPCGNPRNARGWCAMHYQRWVRHGDPLAPTGKWTQRLERLPHGANASPTELAIRHASRMLIANYGITIEDYDAMLAAQGGGCAICHTPPRSKRLHVDHDHADGRVRGLLCYHCNRTIGHIEARGLAAFEAYLHD